MTVRVLGLEEFAAKPVAVERLISTLMAAGSNGYVFVFYPASKYSVPSVLIRKPGPSLNGPPLDGPWDAPRALAEAESVYTRCVRDYILQIAVKRHGHRSACDECFERAVSRVKQNIIDALAGHVPADCADIIILFMYTEESYMTSLADALQPCPQK